MTSPEQKIRLSKRSFETMSRCGAGRKFPVSILCTRSQTVHPAFLKVRAMGVKYYTHFILTGAPDEGGDQEFSGVVEVNQATEHRYGVKEIEALLARNFNVHSNDVRVINWARLQ